MYFLSSNLKQIPKQVSAPFNKLEPHPRLEIICLLVTVAPLHFNLFSLVFLYKNISDLYFLSIHPDYMKMGRQSQ